MSVAGKFKNIAGLLKDNPISVVQNYPGTLSGLIYVPGSALLLMSGIDTQAVWGAVTTLTLPANSIVTSPAYLAAGIIDLSGTTSMALWSDKKIEAHKQDQQIDMQDRDVKYRFLRPWHYPAEYMGATVYPVTGCFAWAAGLSQSPLELTMTACLLSSAMVMQIPERDHKWLPATSASMAFNALKDSYNQGKTYLMKNGMKVAASLFLCVNALQIGKGLTDIYEATASRAKTNITDVNARDQQQKIDNGISFALSGAWFAVGNLFLMRVNKRAQAMPSAVTP